MQESISNFSEKISVFLDKNHDIAFLIFIGVFVFLLIGNILNWKWTYEPKSWVGYHWLELLGPTSYRFWHAVSLVLIIIILAVIYFTTYWKDNYNDNKRHHSWMKQIIIIKKITTDFAVSKTLIA